MMQEFYGFFEAERLTWEKPVLHETFRAYERRSVVRCLAHVHAFVRALVTHKYFEPCIDIIIIANT